MKDIINLFGSSCGDHESAFIKIFETYPYIVTKNCIFFEDFFINHNNKILTLKNYSYEDMYITYKSKHLNDVIEANKLTPCRLIIISDILFDECRIILEETIRKEKLKRLLNV